MKKPDMGLLTQEAEKIVSAIDDESIHVYPTAYVNVYRRVKG